MSENKDYCDCIPCCDCCYGWCTDCDYLCVECNEKCCANDCCNDCCGFFSKVIEKFCCCLSFIFCCFPVQWNYWRKPMPGHKKVEKEWLNLIQTVISANEGNTNLIYNPKLEWSSGLIAAGTTNRDQVHAAATQYIHKRIDEVISCAKESSRRVWLTLRREKADQKLLIALDKLVCFKEMRKLYLELTKKDSEDFEDFRLYDNIICLMEQFKQQKKFIIQWESFHCEIEAQEVQVISG